MPKKRASKEKAARAKKRAPKGAAKKVKLPEPYFYFPPTYKEKRAPRVSSAPKAEKKSPARESVRTKGEGVQKQKTQQQSQTVIVNVGGKRRAAKKAVPSPGFPPSFPPSLPPGFDQPNNPNAWSAPPQPAQPLPRAVFPEGETASRLGLSSTVPVRLSFEGGLAERLRAPVHEAPLEAPAAPAVFDAPPEVGFAEPSGPFAYAPPAFAEEKEPEAYFEEEKAPKAKKPREVTGEYVAPNERIPGYRYNREGFEVLSGATGVQLKTRRRAVASGGLEYAPAADSSDAEPSITFLGQTPAAAEKKSGLERQRGE